MLIREVFEKIGLRVYVPENLLNEELGDVTPLTYTIQGNKYTVTFERSSLKLMINQDDPEEYLVITQSFDDIPPFYESYDIEGVLQKIS